jgi:hypothetical protein
VVCIFLIVDVESRRPGAMGSQCWMWLKDSRRVVVPSGAVVASMSILERGFALIEHSGDGYEDCEVEITSGALRKRSFL